MSSVQYLISESCMPKEGYKSVTIPDDVYDFFWKKWEQLKDEYRAKYGVRSFSGFVTKVMNDMLELESQKRLNPPMEHFNLTEHGVTILDRSLDPPKGQLIDVDFRPDANNRVQAKCEYDETDDCRHVLFALDLPEVQEIFKQKGWKLR